MNKIIFCLLLPFCLLAQTAIVADHIIIDDYDMIPQQYIDSVKTMLLNYPGASHGTGLLYGVELLEVLDGTFAADTIFSGTPDNPTSSNFRISRTFRNLTNTGWTTIGGEEEFYTNPTAIAAMETSLDYHKITLSNPIRVLCFGWCYDMTWHNNCTAETDPVYEVGWAGSSVDGPEGDLAWGLDIADSVITHNSVCMDTYLDAVSQYNAYDATSFVAFYSTGPMDGNESTDEGYQRYIKHEYIRNYVSANGGYLFDYADIISYDDDGDSVNGTWDEHIFPYISTENEGSYDGGHASCHISESACVRLAKGMWWLLARLAGWDGNAVTSSNIRVNGSGKLKGGGSGRIN